jgi:hypothetical protein
LSKAAVLRFALSKPFGSGKELHLPGLRIDARDRVLPALGDPGRPIRPGDHAMRRGLRTELDLLDLAVFGSRMPSAP